MVPKKTMNNQQQPFFSIVIPTYNRPERLNNCLESMTKLKYPRDRFEIIIVDDGSQMSLEPVVSPFCSYLEITLLKQANAGPASARNTGAKQAKGEYLAFTDDDCMPAPDWLNKLASRFVAQPDYLIGGRTINALSTNLYSAASQQLIDYLYGYYNHSSEKAQFFASNNIAVPTEIFHKIGGFDTCFPLAAAEDREFCDRWLQSGYRMIYAAEVCIYHAHYLTLPSFWRQHFFYGRGAFCFHQVCAKRAAKPIKVEPLSFYLNLLTYPFNQTSLRPGFIISWLLFLSQLAATFGFFWERAHQTTTIKLSRK
ncbi:MAG: glycosyltransferase [Oscillatoria sp. PMC 1051.18]|nr:glycosyltransferase [Oscillatoria sp. PMC 1050.18]MEC5030928.1 glycosyltransferase [Oscillatoria sp. PMC 1051.18]